MPGLLRALLTEEAWREFAVPNGELVRYELFSEFVAASPPRDLGADLDLVRRVVSSDPVAVDLLDQALQRPTGRPPETVRNTHDIERPATGTKARSLRKLRKDGCSLAG